MNHEVTVPMTRRAICPNAGDDKMHAKRSANSPGGLCHSCHREATKDDREAAAAKEKVAKARWTQSCIDCRTQGLPLTRPATSPGPRCATHKREFKKMSKDKRHETRVQSVFGLSDGEYALLYEAQGGRCAWPKCRANGTVKRLAVDHDHSCCPGSTSCGRCVRGLLCGPHNQQIGQNGDDPAVFIGVAEYLRRPPARSVLLRYDGDEDLGQAS